MAGFSGEIFSGSNLFDNIKSGVLAITARPDLVTETEFHIRAATLKMHNSDFYPKDLFGVGLEFSSPSYIQSLEYKSLVPRWRQIKYLRKYANNIPGDFITILTPDMILDRWGVDKVDIAYIAGNMLEIRSSSEDVNMLLGCYLHPDLTYEGYNSWIAVEHPFSIIYEAAYQLFITTGLMESASAMRNELQQQVAMIRMSQLATVGE